MNSLSLKVSSECFYQLQKNITIRLNKVLRIENHVNIKTYAVTHIQCSYI